MKSFGLNVVVAMIWLLLSEESTPVTFGVGFLIGFVFLGVFQPILGSGHYVRAVLACSRFLLIFTREFIVANAKVIWTVLFRSKRSLHPNFLTYDVAGLTRPEILLLSYCISLTPGTTTVVVTEDYRTLIIHALDADTPDEIRASIDRTLKRGILSFTR
jgi:multisubunit Na+/H+ antiporter MnhE subunit